FDEPLTPEIVAEMAGVRVTLVTLLVKNGLLGTIDDRLEEPLLLPRAAVLRLRKMQRLRRDLKVNFAGAGVLLDMVERMEAMRREMAEMRARFNL
ncbi:MAG TPA: chaperone modulator CbpM, partial [Pyrinomonadaceae bacterium]|nr:chaperone modulator CbpM [Pyrinomonadaceae bacterium]